MNARLAGALGLVLFSVTSALQALVPNVIDYQGRVAVNGVNFSGPARSLGAKHQIQLATGDPH